MPFFSLLFLLFTTFILFSLLTFQYFLKKYLTYIYFNAKIRYIKRLEEVKKNFCLGVIVMIYSQNIDGTFTIKKLNVVINGVEKKFKNINFNTLDDLQNFLSQF